jgi:hypothetical protein
MKRIRSKPFWALIITTITFAIATSIAPVSAKNDENKAHEKTLKRRMRKR